MKMAVISKFLIALLVVFLIDPRPASSEDMKNFSSEVLGAMKDSNPNSPLWIAGHKMVGWRFLDKNNQSLGKIADIAVKMPEGDFEKIYVAQDSISFVKMLQFDVQAHNIAIEDQVMFADLDRQQIFNNVDTFLENGASETETLRLSRLMNALVTLPDGTKVGRIKDTLSPAKTLKLQNLLVFLTGDRAVIAIPFSEILVAEKDGNLSIIVTVEQYKIMQQFAK